MSPEVEILQFFARFIETELGIVYAEHNYFQLQNRLEDIARLMGVANLQTLHEQAKKGIAGHFRQLLLDVATNNETSFFRDPNVFKAMESTLIPDVVAKAGTNKIRIWSAAASTGQEALSVAMLIEEWAFKNFKQVQYHITGTDISERALTRAKSSNYSQLEVQRGLPAPLMVKYFTKDDQDRWTAGEKLTKNVTFKSQNLKEPYPFTEKFDVVLCRNVLIYQSVEGKKAILERITQTLRPDGYLIMGSGESLMGLSEDYDKVAVDGAVIYRKKVAAKSLAA